MKLFLAVILMSCVGGLSSFAQDVPPLIYGNKVSEAEQKAELLDVQTAAARITNAINMINDPMIENLMVPSFVVENGTTPLTKMALETQGDVSLKSKFVSTLQSLQKNDPMNWKPQFIKYVKELADASAAVRDFADEELSTACEAQGISKDCKTNKSVVAPKLTADNIRFWMNKQNRVLGILQDVQNNAHLTTTPPSIIARIQDHF